VNRCQSCGFVYLGNWEQSIAKAEQLYDYYDRFSDEDVTLRYTPENRARQQMLLNALASYTRGRKLLDVGCGIGQLLETAKDEGWDARGIDLSDTAIQLCRGRELSAFKTDFFDGSLDEQRFDVIVMSELIEHVPSPQRFLKRAEALLTPDGVLYLTTPNFGSLARRLLAESWSVVDPQHVGYFERSTLSKMASEETSLGEIKIEANNIALSTVVTWLRRRRTPTVRAAQQLHRGDATRSRPADAARGAAKLRTERLNRAAQFCCLARGPRGCARSVASEATDLGSYVQTHV